MGFDRDVPGEWYGSARGQVRGEAHQGKDVGGQCGAGGTELMHEGTVHCFGRAQLLFPKPGAEAADFFRG